MILMLLIRHWDMIFTEFVLISDIFFLFFFYFPIIIFEVNFFQKMN